MADTNTKPGDASGEPEVVSEILYDKDGHATKDPKVAVTGNVVLRLPDGTLQYHRILKTPSQA